MNITIDDTKLTGLNAIVSRLNAEAMERATDETPANLTTPEAYLTARVNDILDSYTKEEVERLKRENDEFFTKAALLPPEKQEQLKAMVASMAE